MTALHPGLDAGSVPAQVRRPGRAAPSGVALRVVPPRRSSASMPVAPVVEPGDPVAGRLLVDAARSALSPHLAGRRVAVTVGGERHVCEWGRTLVELPAGRHVVAIEVEHGGGWGHVAEAVPVPAGAVVPVYYRAPVLPGLAGSIAPTPRRGADLGRVAAAGLAALTIVVAATLVLVALVAALAG